jgi:hypothetical protein
MKKYLLIWAVAWIIIYAIVSGIGYPNALSVVLGTAIISLFFLFKIIGSSWTGEVTEIKTEKKYYSDDDGGSTRDIDYAYIKLANGKIKKVQDLGWKVGDKLEKKRGQTRPRLIS